MLTQRLRSAASLSNLRQPYQKPTRRTASTAAIALIARDQGLTDEARHLNPGTPTGITYAASRFSGFPALSFDGATSNVNFSNIGMVQDLAVSSTGMTVSFWMNPTSTSIGTLMDKSDGNTSSGGWWIDMNRGTTNPTAGFFFVVECGTANLYVQVATPPTTGVWTHVVVTYDGHTLSSTAGAAIYFNGVAQSLTLNQAGSGTQATDSGNPFIVGFHNTAGSSDSGNGFYSGAIDNIIIDRYMWDAARVQQMFANPFGHLLPFASQEGPQVGRIPLLATSTVIMRNVFEVVGY